MMEKNSFEGALQELLESINDDFEHAAVQVRICYESVFCAHGL